MIHENKLAKKIKQIQTGDIEIEQYLEELENREGNIEPDIKSLLPEENRWARIKSNIKEIKNNDIRPHDKKPLFGLPVGIKDIIHVNNFDTKANSSVPTDLLNGPEATVVKQLKNAGAIVLGKTVTTEFAYWEPGPTRNPHNLNHTPGGSSSGSAAAVASGLCPLALGTQTIGSIIRPAAFCGIVGFKPSYGRMSASGVIPLSKSLDHVGFFTQDVAGANIAASVLCEDWYYLPEREKKPTLGVPNGAYLEQADPKAVEYFKSQCELLREFGYNIKKHTLFSDISEINTRHERLMAAEAALVHHDWYQSHKQEYSEQMVELLQEGYRVPTSEISAGRQSQFDIRHRIHKNMNKENIDIWIAPGACGPAPKGIDSTGDPTMNLPWTHSGLPTITIPTKDTIGGLPLGIQCVTKYNNDEDLLNWSHQIAQTLQS